jgi:siroheme synthase-like protein
LDVKGRKCVVVGGGQVAERKVKPLLDYEAEVRIISPEITEYLCELVEKGALEHLARSFESGDLRDTFLAIAATDDRDTNLKVSEEASRRGILVNVVDEPGLCTFFVPSVLRRGDFQVGVTTSGKAPILSRKVREDLEGQFGPEYGTYTAVLGAIRERLKSKVAEPELRSRLLEEALEIGLLESVKQGKEVSVPEVVDSLLEQI